MPANANDDPGAPETPPEPDKPRTPAWWDGPGSYEHTGRKVNTYDGPGQTVSVSPGQVLYLNSPIEGVTFKKVED